MSNRDGIGARIRVVSGGLAQTREVRGSRSYLSQSDLRVHFGLGERTLVDSILISWPAGGSDLVTGVRANQFLVVREGSGSPGGSDRTQAGSI